MRGVGAEHPVDPDAGCVQDSPEGFEKVGKGDSGCVLVDDVAVPVMEMDVFRQGQFLRGLEAVLREVDGVLVQEYFHVRMLMDVFYEKSSLGIESRSEKGVIARAGREKQKSGQNISRVFFLFPGPGRDDQTRQGQCQ